MCLIINISIFRSSRAHQSTHQSAHTPKEDTQIEELLAKNSLAIRIGSNESTAIHSFIWVFERIFDFSFVCAQHMLTGVMLFALGINNLRI